MPYEFERVKEVLGEAKAIELRQLRIKADVLAMTSLCNGTEVGKTLSSLRQEANEILAEAGLVSNR